MATYKQIKRKYDIGYTRDGVFIKNDRIPPEVKEKLAFGVPEVKLEDATTPCLFCEAQATHKRVVNMVTAQLCDWHYANMNLGKIAQQLRHSTVSVIQPKIPTKKPDIAMSTHDSLAKQQAEQKKNRSIKYGEVIEIP